MPSLLFRSIACLALVLTAQASQQPAEGKPAAAAEQAPAAADDAAVEEELDDVWDVQTFRGSSHEAAIDTTSGTWMSVDISPDGKQLVFDLLGDIYTLPIEGGEATSIASGIAWQIQPRFSPDGTHIAYCSDEGGGDNLWIAGIDGSDAKAVTKESFRLLNSPAWSPDGRFLVARKHFTERRSLGAGELWLYHVAAGLAETAQAGLQLTKRANEQLDLGEPAYSPDGRYIYFSYDASGGSTFEYSKDSTAGIYAIDRIELETGKRTRVVSGPGGACRPAPSPDGKSLAFVRRVNNKSTLFVMDLRSGMPRAVYGGLERDMQETWALHGVYPGLAWTPDSKEMVLWAAGELRRIDMASGEATGIPFHVSDTRTVQDALRFPVAVAPESFPVKALRQLKVSPAGDRVVYQALGHLWIRNLPDGTPKRLTTQTEHFEFYPAFSRDGAQIVYTTFDDVELGSVRVASASGGEGTALTSEPGHYTNPAFTPDGTQVVYSKGRGGYITSPLWSFEPGLYRIPATGGEPTLITRSGSNPQFTNSSERVFLSSASAGKRTLISITLDGKDQRTHLESANATEFALSPDGNWVAFAERFNAYVAPFVQTGRPVNIGPDTKSIPVHRVTRDAGENLQWSGDSGGLNWSLGPELYSRNLSDSFVFLDGAPEELPEAPMEGVNVSFELPYAAPDGWLALVGARIVTMRGDEVIEEGTILIEGNRIRSVGTMDDIKVPAGARVIDAFGTTIIPGIVDVHYHGSTVSGGLMPESNWVHQANLAFGVTTVHDPSHNTNDIFAAAELAKAGGIVAPRMFSTGTILYGAMGSFKAEIDSLDDARSHLRRLQAVGAISVKSYNQPRRDQRQQVLEAARELGMMVVPEGGSTHHHNLTMVVDGHTGVEHSLPLENIYSDVTQLWGSTDVGYTPTLIVGYGGIWGEDYWYDTTDVWRHERLRSFVPSFVVEPRSRRRPKAPEEDYNTLRSAGIAKAIVDAGARVQLGAHGQLAGLGAHWELWMFEQGGMTQHEALRSATLSGAIYLGLDGDIGSIAPGKLADLVIIDGNPLEDLRCSDKVRHTLLNGVLFDAASMAVHGDAASAPQFFWHGIESGLPHQHSNASCAGCTH